MSYSSYSYKSSSGSGGRPSSSNYTSSYKSSSGGGGMPVGTGLSMTSGAPHMDAEMARMRREMEMGTGGLAPTTSIHVQSSPHLSSGGTTTKKVVTTTTTKTNPAAQMEFDRLERDFSRIGRTPDDYHDDFDKIKRDVLSGEAYRGDKVTHEPVGIRMREEHVRGTPSGHAETTTTTTKRSYGTGAPVTEETVTTTTKSGGGSMSNRPSHSEVFIPVKTYDSTFDDFHMNRWMDHRDHFGSIPSTDLDLHRMDWQNRLGGVKSGMFKFSPHMDMAGASSNIESSRTVAKNPLGKPEFSVQFDMRDFKPEDISLTTKHGKLIISATHEEKMGNSTSRREFTRSVDLPSDIQVNLMRSVFSRDGVLSITAPIKPPHYDNSSEISMLQQPGQFGHTFMKPPGFYSSSSFDPITTTQQQHETHTSVLTSTSDNSLPSTSGYSSGNRSPPQSPPKSTAVSSYSPSQSPPVTPPRSQFSSALSRTNSSTNNQLDTANPAESLDFTLSTAGFNPEDLTVTVEGRKVKVRGKHVETRIGGRKTHNEFTKVFDLPTHVAAECVKCYIQDGHTLHVVSEIRDDITGAVHFLPVTRKW